MASPRTRPLIDAQGEARSPTAEEWRWSVAAADFADFGTAMRFVDDREAFLAKAEAAGLPRWAFLPFAPTKPGFIERATAALEQAARAGRHAAE